METKVTNFLKIISVVAFCLIHLPTQKFSIPLGLICVAVLLEIRELVQVFTWDVFFVLLIFAAIIHVFHRNKLVFLLAYLVLIFVLLISISYNQSKNFDYLFWIPLVVFVVTFLLGVYYKFKVTRDFKYFNSNETKL